jgi:hypothetical protein
MHPGAQVIAGERELGQPFMDGSTDAEKVRKAADSATGNMEALRAAQAMTPLHRLPSVRHMRVVQWDERRSNPAPSPGGDVNPPSQREAS